MGQCDVEFCILFFSVKNRASRFWHKPRRLWPPHSGACAHAFLEAFFPETIVKPGFEAAHKLQRQLDTRATSHGASGNTSSCMCDFT